MTKQTWDPNSSLEEQLTYVVSELATDPVVRNEFEKAIASGKYLRDQNPEDHLIVYMLPIDTEKKKVLLIHHVKSGLWLPPGGHVEPGENLVETAEREVREELGINDFEIGNPFCTFITHITQKVKKYSCRKHLEIGFPVFIGNEDLDIEKREIHKAKWVSTKGASRITDDPSTLRAVEIVGETFFTP